jgi:hypothetical protein
MRKRLSLAAATAGAAGAGLLAYPLFFRRSCRELRPPFFGKPQRVRNQQKVPNP